MNPEILAAVAFGSLIGSLHCIGMCGGFVALYTGSGAVKTSRWPHLVYNLGRMTTYVALGAIGGTLGAALNIGGGFAGLRETAAIVCGVLLAVWGLSLLLRNTLGLQLKSPAWLNRALSKVLPKLLKRPPLVRALALGMASVLLPCPWLYGFVVTAAGSGSAVAGAAVMFAFWIGTVPAMLGAGLGLDVVARWVGPKLPVLMPTLLIILGLMTITQRSFMIPQITSTSEVASCHAH